MIDLGGTDFLLGVRSIPQDALEKYSTRLFEEWEEHVGKILRLKDYSLALEVEEGSISGKGKIAATLGVIYLGIGNYGDFISGVRAIGEQVRSASDYLPKRAVVPFHPSSFDTEVHRQGGSLSQLQRLFVRVQRRELSAAQAMREAESMLGQDSASSPEFMRALQDSLIRTPLHPEQLPLISDDADNEPAYPPRGKERKPRSSRPMPILPPPQQLRVEVWRESKKGKRRIRVIRL